MPELAPQGDADTSARHTLVPSPIAPAEPAGGRVTWPFIVFQMNRNSGSGNVSATITSITYYSYP